MKTIKVFIYGKRMRDVYPHPTKWKMLKYHTAMFARKVAMVAILVISITGTFIAGSYFMPTIKTQTVEALKQVDPDYPILDKIARAESYNSQFCTQDIVNKKGCHKYEVGSVLIHINSNGTYDIGKYAINSIHLADAMKLGYNVYQENDNFEYAKYLFRNQGSEPWSASKVNWQK